jgi:hypothetical protein
MKKFKIIAVEFTSVVFIILFIYAGASKLLDYQNFESQLGRSPMLARYSGWYWIVPAIEIIIAVFLAIQKFRLEALYASFSLMTVFTTYIIVILNYSEYVPCSCGGVLQHMSWTSHLWFNIIFIGLAASAIIFSKKDTMPHPNG